MKKFLLILLVVSIAVLSTGCLTFDKKEYSWKINPNGSGSGKIVYKNIFSSGNTEEDYSGEDFASLINDYIEGASLEGSNPGMKKVQKRLYIEDGKLCGEIVFEFDKFTDVGFYRYKGKGPYMFLLNAGDETYVNSNGELAGEDFPLIFWPEGTKEFKITTSMGDPEDLGAVMLLDFFKTWEETGELPETEDY